MLNSLVVYYVVIGSIFMTTIFVDLNARGINNGATWIDAYTDLQTAIREAQVGDEIWVAKGVYKPTTGINREISFVLKNGVKMYGGFAGNETSINQRNIAKNTTELSGDIGTPGNIENNTYHVVDVSNTTTSSVLDGFSITNGNADNYSSNGYSGGGIYSDNGNAMLKNLIIANNKAEDGGGLYSTNSQHQLTNVFFFNNSADDDGGGLYNYSSNLSLNEVTFSGNYSKYRGGGIFNYDSSPEITNSNFLSNSAEEGGGVYNSYSSSPTINRTVFQDNIAESYGGGLYNNEYYYYDDESPLVANSIFEGNISLDGGGIYNDYSNAKVVNSTFTNNKSKFDAAIRSEVPNEDYIPTIINSIIWDNDSFADNKLIDSSGETNAIINNSIVEEGYEGKNIITVDPSFIDPDRFDFRLADNSPALNIGNNNAIANYDLDLVGSERIVNNTVDLGAYEGSEGTAPKMPSLSNESVIIYVDKDARGSDNGKSWTNAYTDLQDAIAAAPFGSQIWVAEGTYKPTSQSEEQAREISFNLKNGVAIYGGFAGNETNLNRREPEDNLTVLSGDIGTVGDRRDNSYHVVKTSNTTSSTILDGFTIKDGNANEYRNSNDFGGGIYAEQSYAVFANLTIKNNSASDDGGGVYVNDGLTQFINVSFIDNTAYNGGGFYNYYGNSILASTVFNGNTAKGSGGAIFSSSGDLIIDGGTFFSNIAEDNGGALYTSYSTNFNAIDTIFSSNKAGSDGGAIYSYNTDNDSTIVNSIFDGNSSKQGGAIYNYDASTVGINLTFANNQAESGAAVYSQGSEANPTYVNSIFWSNQATNDLSATPIINNNADTFVSHSIIEGGYVGEEIIDRNPQFADLESGDLRLKSNSPAIDIGYSDFVTEDTDINGNIRITDEAVDLGAYEYFAEQNLSSDAGTIGDNNISVVEEPVTETPVAEKPVVEEPVTETLVEEPVVETLVVEESVVEESVELSLQLTEVHRFYQYQNGFHFYTASDRESNVIQEKSKSKELKYNYEGESFAALASNKDGLSGEVIEDAKEVYRFFNSDTGAHLFTMDVNEKDYIVANLDNYTLEGVTYYAFTEEQEKIETIPVYRMYNGQTNTHLLTIDTNEVNYIQENLPHFKLEGDNGVAFHVLALD